MTGVNEISEDTYYSYTTSTMDELAICGMRCLFRNVMVFTDEIYTH